MKRDMHVWIVIGLLMLAITAGGCRTRNDSTASNRNDRSINSGRTVDASDNNNDNQNSASDQKKAYENKAEARLDEFDNRLDQLRSRSNNPKEGVKAADQNIINDLNMKNEAAKKMLSEIKSADANSWQDMRSSMDKALADLENSYNRAGIVSGTVTNREDRDLRDNQYGTSSSRNSRRSTMSSDSKDQSQNAKDQKNTYEQAMGTRLDAFEKRLSDFESNVNTKDNKSNAAVVDELKMKIDVAHTILNHIKSADVATWHRMKGDMDHAISDLDRSYKATGLRTGGNATSSGEKSRRH